MASKAELEQKPTAVRPDGLQGLRSQQCRITRRSHLALPIALAQQPRHKGPDLIQCHFHKASTGCPVPLRLQPKGSARCHALCAAFTIWSVPTCSRQQAHVGGRHGRQHTHDSNSCRGSLRQQWLPPQGYKPHQFQHQLWVTCRWSQFERPGPSDTGKRSCKGVVLDTLEGEDRLDRHLQRAACSPDPAN